ncbi:MAG: class I adenylate-forming enzyme family protein [Myxococcota bacterium]|jgi:acyl-CoA synthetase (AMP-forming)/AMP-acid ligase II|nr:class I adenylate-forming enzyme family protein [Myxococcota bacterium]
MLIPDILRKTTSHVPHKTAVLLDGVGSMTYGEWEASSNRLARALVDRGLRPGERVALLFKSDAALTYLTTYMAIHKAGGVAVPLNPRLSDPEILRTLAHCEASALCGSGARTATLDLPLVTDAMRLDGPTLTALASEGDAGEFQVARDPEDLADILYTSGTTGHPKAVACTHANVTYKGSSTLHKLFRKATFCHAIPLFTFAGSHAMTLIPLRAGMTSVIQPKFDANRFLELLAEHRVNLAYAVPSMVLLMLDAADIRTASQADLPTRGREEGGADLNFDALKLLMYGTAPMPPDAIRRLATVFPSTMLVNLYGLTEGGATVCSLSPMEAQKRPDSIGKPLPPTEVRIVDDEGQALAPREHGEILMRSADVSPRFYYRDEDASAETWTDEGWLRTGDIGFVDEDGYLYLVDRKKDLIIRGGFNISAPEVEGVLSSHPAVLDAAVVGVSHPILGEDIKAFVVRRDGEPVTADALKAFGAEQLADYKVPREIAFVDALPRNAIGKVLKRELRSWA